MKLRGAWWFGFVAMIGITLSSCSNEPTVGSEPISLQGAGDQPLDGQLLGRIWLLESIETQDGLTTIPMPERYTIKFTKDSLVVEVRADCNWCGGNYKVSDHAIEIRMGCTEVACLPESHGSAYDIALIAAHSFDVGTYWLEIKFGSAPGVLRFFTAQE